MTKLNYEVSMYSRSQNTNHEKGTRLDWGSLGKRSDGGGHKPQKNPKRRLAGVGHRCKPGKSQGKD